MTAVGFLYPGHTAEDDYERFEQLLEAGVRLSVVHLDTGEDAAREGAPREDTAREDALVRMGEPEQLAAGVEELRLAGAEAVIWASTSGSFAYGWDGAREQVRKLAIAAGMPASNTSFAFVHAAQYLGATRVAVAATYPEDVAVRFADFLKLAGIEVTGTRAGDAAGVGTWGRDEILELALAGDHRSADVVLLPDTALHTAAHLAELEQVLGKPVLTANQVSVWEGLRLAERRVWGERLGKLFARRV